MEFAIACIFVWIFIVWLWTLASIVSTYLIVYWLDVFLLDISKLGIFCGLVSRWCS